MSVKLNAIILASFSRCVCGALIKWTFNFTALSNSVTHCPPERLHTFHAPMSNEGRNIHESVRGVRNTLEVHSIRCGISRAVQTDRTHTSDVVRSNERDGKNPNYMWRWADRPG